MKINVRLIDPSMFDLIGKHLKKKQQKANERDVKYFKVVRSLVRRYVMNEQRIQERQRGVTEDDCNEIKQEISALRYNLLELLGARKKSLITLSFFFNENIEIFFFYDLLLS